MLGNVERKRKSIILISKFCFPIPHTENQLKFQNQNHGNAKRDLVPSTQTLKRTSSLHPLNNKPSFH